MWKPVMALALALAALTGFGTTPVAGIGYFGSGDPLGFGGCAHYVLIGVHERRRLEAEERRQMQARDAEFQRQVAQLRPRAEAGDPEASYRLGWHLYPKPEGIAWLCRAADRRHATARYIIALNYERGYLRAKDRVRAHLWYELAAAAGHTDAAAERDKLAAQLTPQELADLRRLASAWRPGQCEAAIDKPRNGG